MQVTTQPISSLDLISYNNERYQGIRNALKGDGLEDQFKRPLQNHKELVDSFKGLDQTIPQNIFDVHDRIQEYLWNNFQRHPQYNRSISFVFTKHIDYTPDSKFDVFHTKFVSLLGNKTYSLDKTQDRKDIFKAMLIAYKTEVDPKVVDKLMHLHNHAGITLNTHFLHDIANYLKHGLI